MRSSWGRKVRVHAILAALVLPTRVVCWFPSVRHQCKPGPSSTSQVACDLVHFPCHVTAECCMGVQVKLQFLQRSMFCRGCDVWRII